MPKQKPGKSKQDYGTPKEFLSAVKNRLCINDFAIDLAASAENTVTNFYIGEEQNSLLQEWHKYSGWCWLNPPYTHIDPWVKKCKEEAVKGAHIACLVPASVGANWWSDHVEAYAYQSYLNGRLTFLGTPPNPKTGKIDAYPKDCALLLYTPWRFSGHEIWEWRTSNEPIQTP